jgi:CheY-like chemotaxis protein
MTQPPRDQANPTSDLRVLLVDDHPVSRRAIELILAPFGASVTMAENGRASVETFSSSEFDLVLMDKRMPVLDGLAATREIRSIERERGRPAIPILMLSADAAVADLEQASAAGCSGHVAKPVTPEALLEAIQQALAKP